MTGSLPCPFVCWFSNACLEIVGGEATTDYGLGCTTAHQAALHSHHTGQPIATPLLQYQCPWWDGGAEFTRQIVQPIPRGWGVGSLAVTDDERHLLVTLLRGGGLPPLVVRRVLDCCRFAEVRDGFRQVCRDSDDSLRPNAKGEALNEKDRKRDWWERREAIDRALRDVLDRMGGELLGWCRVCDSMGPGCGGGACWWFSAGRC